MKNYKLLKDLTDEQTGVTFKAGTVIDVLISEVPRLQKEGYLAPQNTPEMEPVQPRFIASNPPEKPEKTK